MPMFFVNSETNLLDKTILWVSWQFRRGILGPKFKVFTSFLFIHSLGRTPFVSTALAEE